jgi:LEA14-like dessication related protein
MLWWAMHHRWPWVPWLLAFAGAVLVCACMKLKPPTLHPRAARVTQVGPTGIGLVVELDVANPNAFPLAVRTVSGTLEVGSGTEVGRGHAEPGKTIPAQGSSVVEAQLTVGWTKLEALAPYALSPSPVPYRFRGTASVGSERLNVDVPFVVTGELTRDQLLQAGLRGLGAFGLSGQ